MVSNFCYRALWQHIIIYKQWHEHRLCIEISDISIDFFINDSLFYSLPLNEPDGGVHDMDQSQRNYYKTNIAALNLTAALVKSEPLNEKEDDAKWPCLEEVSGKGLSTETSSTTSRGETSNASNHKRKPFCTIGMCYVLIRYYNTYYFY